MTTALKLDITHGGSKGDLFSQLWEVGKVHPQPFVVWVKQPGDGSIVRIGLHINVIAAESGSGDGWNVKGAVATSDVGLRPWLRGCAGFTGYYHSGNKTGWLSPYWY